MMHLLNQNTNCCKKSARPQVLKSTTASTVTLPFIAPILHCIARHLCNFHSSWCALDDFLHHTIHGGALIIWKWIDSFILLGKKKKWWRGEQKNGDEAKSREVIRKREEKERTAGVRKGKVFRITAETSLEPLSASLFELMLRGKGGRWESRGLKRQFKLLRQKKRPVCTQTMFLLANFSHAGSKLLK